MERYLLPRKMALALFAGLGALSFLSLLGMLPQLISALPRFSLCPFRLLTHLDCPGCGMTRSFIALAGGDLKAAACFNPFSFFLVFVAALSLIPPRYLEKEPPRTTRCMRYFYVALLAVVLVYWVVFRVFEAVPSPL
jgi:hypothetical protein